MKSNLDILVKRLSSIGEKSTNLLINLRIAENFLVTCIKSMGYTYKCYPYDVNDIIVNNYEVEIKGKSDKIIVLGSHYDTILSGGANDNSSGVAGLLYLLDCYKKTIPNLTLRFCFFVNEEPPYFMTEQMGSYQYVKMCKERQDNISLAIIFDLIGYYTNEANTQEYPSVLLYKKLPTIANFIAFIGSKNNDKIITGCSNIFKSCTDFPIQHLVFDNNDFYSYCSDHGSFSKFDIPSFLITDTAYMRYKYYHTEYDTYEKLNYVEMEKMLTTCFLMVERISDEII